MSYLQCFIFYLHIIHDELEEPSQGAAFLFYSRIHFPQPWKKKSSKRRKKKLPTNFRTTPKRESIGAFYAIQEGSNYTTPRVKSTFKKKQLWKRRKKKNTKTHSYMRNGFRSSYANPWPLG